MTENKKNPSNQILDKFLDLLKRLSWMDILFDVVNFGMAFLKGSTKAGMYEVLEYESTLKFLDP